MIRLKDGMQGTINGFSIEKSVPSNAVFTDTNTWRPIVDNLTSTVTDQSLSANQGKILKGLIDGKAATTHGNHVPAIQSANNAIFLRNDNSWATITPNNIGAATASHGTHVNYGGNGVATTVSRSDHSHSYLPLNGGTVSGTVNLTGNTNCKTLDAETFTSGMCTVGTLKATYLATSPSGGINFNNDDYLAYNDTTNTFSFSSDGAVAKSTVEAGAFTGPGFKGSSTLCLTCDNITVDDTTDNSGRLRFRSSSGSYYFDPQTSGTVRLGSTTYRWNILYTSNAVNVSSDRNLKENIKYIQDDSINPNAEIEERFSLYEMYSFVKDGLDLATYNLISNPNPEDIKLGFIAQDMLYTANGEENKIGQLIVTNAKEAKDENTTLSYDTGNYTSVLAGALKQAINKIETLELRIIKLENKRI